MSRWLAFVSLIVCGCAADDGHCGVPCPGWRNQSLGLGSAPYSELVDGTVTVAENGRDAAAPVPIPENGYYEEAVFLWNVRVHARANEDDPSLADMTALIDYTSLSKADDVYTVTVRRADGSITAVRSWTATYDQYVGCRGDTCATITIIDR